MLNYEIKKSKETPAYDIIENIDTNVLENKNLDIPQVVRDSIATQLKIAKEKINADPNTHKAHKHRLGTEN
ncbi:MAG: hypothetical protein LBL90_10825 [Prevotellaceae bacterium]|nr:hypothetical protein [Prevotellaceae bacterium]